MSDERNIRASRVTPAEEAARESRHEVLRELLGAYADRELPPETMAQIDAHLVGCAECRSGLEVHDAVRTRLAAERPAAPSPALRARIAAAIDAVPAPVVVPAPAPRAINQRSVVWLAVAGWVAAVVLAIALAVQTPASPQRAAGARAMTAPVQQVPLLGGIVDDYARVSRGDLSGTRSRPVRRARGRLLPDRAAARARRSSPWRVDDRRPWRAGGRPRVSRARPSRRAVPRRRGRVLPSSRRANGGGRSPSADRGDGGRALVAWPGTSTGTVLVGDVPVGVAADHLELGETALILLPTARVSRLRVFSPLVAVALSGAFAAPAVARAQTPTSPPASTPPAVAPDTLSPDSLAARLARAEAAIAALRQQLATESQSTVRTRSRLQLDLTGRILTNFFLTTGRVNNVDVPGVALAPSPTPVPEDEAFGVIVRQYAARCGRHRRWRARRQLRRRLRDGLLRRCAERAGGSSPLSRASDAHDEWAIAVVADGDHGRHGGATRLRAESREPRGDGHSVVLGLGQPLELARTAACLAGRRDDDRRQHRRSVGTAGRAHDAVFCGANADGARCRGRRRALGPTRVRGSLPREVGGQRLDSAAPMPPSAMAAARSASACIADGSPWARAREIS